MQAYNTADNIRMHLVSLRQKAALEEDKEKQSQDPDDPGMYSIYDNKYTYDDPGIFLCVHVFNSLCGYRFVSY